MNQRHHGLLSPTCGPCAIAKRLVVPGGVHTIYMGICANCQKHRPVSSALDWRRPTERVHPDAMD